MRTEQITIYKFDELSEDAQQKAIDNYRAWDTEIAWAGEWRDSLDEWEKIAPVTVTYWRVSPGYQGSYINVEWAGEYMAGELSGVRAWKWLQNNGWFEDKLIGGNCPFTGYVGDECLLDAIREFKVKPDSRTLAELFQDCADEWHKGYSDDIEYQNSDEYIREQIELNEYEFYNDGSMI